MKRGNKALDGGFSITCVAVKKGGRVDGVKRKHRYYRGEEKFHAIKGMGQNIIIDDYESMNRTCYRKNGFQCFSSTSK